MTKVEFEVRGNVPKGALVVMRGADLGLDQDRFDALAKELFMAVGHREFFVLDLPEGDVEIQTIEEFCKVLRSQGHDITYNGRVDNPDD